MLFNQGGDELTFSNKISFLRIDENLLVCFIVPQCGDPQHTIKYPISEDSHPSKFDRKEHYFCIFSNDLSAYIFKENYFYKDAVTNISLENVLSIRLPLRFS